MKYDTIVIGLGCVGSSTIYELSKYNANVLGIEQFNTPNDMGSSHGSSRIMRLAYYEGGKYVPLLYDAIEKWIELEKYANEKLFYQNGSLTIGLPESDKFKYSKKTCDEFDIPYKYVNSNQLSNQFPEWNIPSNFKAFYQPEGGVLDNNICIKTQIKEAKNNGVDIHTNERVINWEKKNSEIIVKTNKHTYKTESLVISSGPWAKNHIDVLSDILKIERHVAGYLEMKSSASFEKSNFPAWIMDTGSRKFYGLPKHKSECIKIGDTTNKDIISDMTKFNRKVINSEIESIRKFCDKYIQSDLNRVNKKISCPLTNTPDGDFIIDEIENNIFIGVGLSGHGFKLSNIIGIVLSDLIQDGKTDYNIKPFKLNRFDI